MKNNKKKILIIDDEKILSDILEEKLQTNDFAVIKTDDGVQGLKIAINEHPDLILLDLLLPNIDGLTILKKIREDDWGKCAKVIILTNINDSSKIADSMDVGLDGTFEYLVKTNCSVDNIVSRIKEKIYSVETMPK